MKRKVFAMLVGYAGLVATAPAWGQLKLDDKQPKEIDKENILQNRELILKYEPLIPQIKAALRSNNAETKRAALAIITDIPEELSRQSNLAQDLLDFLKTPGHTAELQALALKSFGRTSPTPQDARNVLQSAMQSPDVRVQRAGVSTAAALVASAAPELKSIANAEKFLTLAEAAMPTLGPAMENEHTETQRTAQAGMKTIAKVLSDVYEFERSPIRKEFRIDPEKWNAVIPVLKAIDAQLPRFKKGFASPDADARRTQAEILEKFTKVRRMTLQTHGRDKPDPFTTGLKDILTTLDTQADDPDATVRLAVIQAVEPLSDLDAGRAIMIRKATDSSLFVRWTTARGLGLAAPPEPKDGYVAEISALTKLANDQDADVRSAAMAGLQRFKGLAATATNAVLVNAKEGDAEARVIAINTLTEIKSDATTSIPVLIDAVQDKDVRVQRAAASALVRFGANAKDALPVLRTAVVSDDIELRFAAAQAILAIEKPRKDD